MPYAISELVHGRWPGGFRWVSDASQLDAGEVMRRDREMLDENRAALGLPPLGSEWEPEQAHAFGIGGEG